MIDPIVSVVIPAYNQADFLGDAIESVLNQTYQNFEIIVVDDASPDHTAEVVKRFNDTRLKYIVHEKNQMLSAARNTGIKASSGEIIALLDADDYFHPEKLEMHVDFLGRNPDVGVSYNARFELNYSARTIHELIRPPLWVGLSDLVLGFPFTPSDMVIRREWAFRVNLFDESYTAFSEDLDINCRLALHGCRFAGINRALNYRSHHSGRVIKNISSRLEAALRALDLTFADPRCPLSVLDLKNLAYMNNYLVWAYYAFEQNETTLGQRFLKEAIQLDPSILDGDPSELVKFLMINSIQDECLDHAELLSRIFSQLPTEAALHLPQYDWAVARGFVLRGMFATIWGRYEQGHAYMKQAVELRADIDDALLRYVADQLLSYAVEFGDAPIHMILQNLLPDLEKIGGRIVGKKLKGLFWVNHAFWSYYSQTYRQVPQSILKATVNDPTYLANRGVLSILYRSLLNRLYS